MTKRKGQRAKFIEFIGFIEFVESMETGDTIETGRDSWRYSRDEANEIATGFALATTSSDCRAPTGRGSQ